MIAIAMHIETLEVFNDIQDTPAGAYVAGSRARRAAVVLGGSAGDYMEYIVPAKERHKYFGCKGYIYDKPTNSILPVRWSQVELDAQKKELDIQTTEESMIDAQVKVDASVKLGLDNAEVAAELEELKAKHAELSA